MGTNEKIKVMQHFADGGEVEYMTSFSEGWKLNKSPDWNWFRCDYRIKPESLEDRIKAEHSDYKVKEIKDNGYGVLSHDGTSAHILAQSMKGFAGYVYEDDAKFYIYREATDCILIDQMDVITHPVAVLFTKDSKEEA